MDLAAYLLARHTTGRPVDPHTKDLLKRANQSKKDVLSIMSYGRGNVTTDLRHTRNVGFHRLLAQRHLVKSTSSLGVDPTVTHMQDAALAAYAGCGNCGEFANVAAHVHAGRLLAGERVRQHSARDTDHSWIVVQGQPTQDGSVPQAIIEAWGDGPVVEVVDHAYTKNAAPPDMVHGIVSTHGPALHRQFEQARQDPGVKAVKRFNALFVANARDQKQPTGTVYAPRPFVCQQFAQAAKTSIEGRQCELTLRAQAAALAREVVPSLSPARVESTVDAIFDLAVSLDAPRARSLAGATQAHVIDLAAHAVTTARSNLGEPGAR